MKSTRKWNTTAGRIKTTYLSVTVAQSLTVLKIKKFELYRLLIEAATSFLQDSRRRYEMEVRNQAMALERQLRRGGPQVSLYFGF